LAHKTQVKFRSHFSGKNNASYGPGNTVIFKDLKPIYEEMAMWLNLVKTHSYDVHNAAVNFKQGLHICVLDFGLHD